MTDDVRGGRIAFWIRFLFLLATVGFFLGTLTLLGPVRWVTGRLREMGSGQGAEDLTVRAVILLLLAGSAALAWWLARRTATRGQRFGIPVLAAALALGALWVWMNPGLLRQRGPALDREGRFVFGPYPSREDLATLKAEGYAGVITLLHPAVAPFEPKLLADERAAARAVGIRLIEAPMLPWISDNAASLERIREVAQDTAGRYYVHCYLGRDRVSVVRRLLAQVDPSLDPASGVTNARDIATNEAFERGSLHHFRDSVHVGPFPSDEEWFGEVLNGTVRQVVSLLDPEAPDDARWLARERRLAGEYRMPLEVIPLRGFPYDPAAALAAAERVRALPRPVFVHGFLTESAAVQAFALAYRTGLPPLPPALFREPMTAGPVRLLAVNVAAGPQPRGADYGSYLWRRGVRGVVFVGPEGHAGERAGRGIAREVGLEWRTVRPGDPALAGLLAAGGPWYLFGPGLERAEAALAGRLTSADLPIVEW